MTLRVEGRTRAWNVDARFSGGNPQAVGPAGVLDTGPRIDYRVHTDVCQGKSQQVPPACRLVYLLSQYPAVSHTFFLNEIRELRKLDFTIEIASINRPDRPHSSMPATEVEEAERTFYIKSKGAAWAVFVAAKTLLRRPRVFTRGLAAALRLGRWDLNATLYAIFYFAEALILGEWMRSRSLRHLHIHFCGPVATVGLLASAAGDSRTRSPCMDRTNSTMWRSSIFGRRSSTRISSYV